MPRLSQPRWSLARAASQSRSNACTSCGPRGPNVQKHVTIPQRVRQGRLSDGEITSVIQSVRLVQVKVDVQGADGQGPKAVHELVQRVAVLMQRHAVRSAAHERIDHLITSGDVLLI